VTTGDPAATWSRVATAVLLVVLATLMIVHIYETVFVLREWAGDRLRSERLQRQELETRIEALETEVDPHVLFNHLNSLSHLVDTGDPRARVFVTALAASYRALLRTRGRRLVPLSEELELLSEFRTLTAIRLGGALRISVAVSKDEADRWWLPPVVLPELVENAIKHNEASIADPLVVRISLCGDRLALMNPIRPKSTPMPSTGFGLRNLVDRFRLTTNRAVTYERREGMFRVMLPLIASDDQSGDAITDRPRIATARAGG
jgi:LytS/YehU family sensor histidine kinase